MIANVTFIYIRGKTRKSQDDCDRTIVIEKKKKDESKRILVTIVDSCTYRFES